MHSQSGFFAEKRESFRNIPIRRKLYLILFVAVLFAIFVASAAVLIYEARTFRPRALQEAETQAKILAAVLVPPLQFNDPVTAKRYLGTLEYRSDISAAILYEGQGRVFARYRRDAAPAWYPPNPPPPGAEFTSMGLSFTFPIIDEGRPIGCVWLREDLPPLYARLPGYGIMFSVVALSLFAVAALLSIALKYSVSLPISSLAGTVSSVTRNKDYSLRAAPEGRDEIGNLTKSFNEMLEAIGQRDHSLRESEERFSKAFLASPIPIAITRIGDAVVIDINQSNLKLLGCKREEIVGRPVYEVGLIDKAQFESIRRMTLALGAIREMEVAVRTKPGERRNVLISLEIIEVGGEKCFLSVSEDITDRKRVEEELRQSQKMDAIGRLAGGIAHDFNNLLTAINGYSSMALEGMDPSKPLYPFLAEILKSGERAAGLTRQLLAYSRKQILETKVWDLNVIVKDMEAMLRRIIGEDIDMVAVLGPGAQLVKVDRGQVEQVILNLVLNARDAMPGGGKLILETGRALLDKTFSGTHLESPPGRYVVLSVRDTGMGMTPEVKARLFEPFFTTKAVGKGTGLGLSVVYGIVQQSGGSITVYSETEKGTAFHIYFPAIHPEKNLAWVPAEGVSIESYQGNETVLLVEDESSVRKFACNVLDALGYTIREAVNGREALDMLRDPTFKIDLVLTDVVMPEMGGVTLAKELQNLRPGLPILFMSGYSEHASVHNGLSKTGENFLQKPFTPSELARKVRSVMDQAGVKSEKP